jgi:hypothetical protein
MPRRRRSRAAVESRPLTPRRSFRGSRVRRPWRFGSRRCASSWRKAASSSRVREGIERCRAALMAGEASLDSLITREGWYCDLRPLRYLSHFTTPTSSPIRFAARFFLGPMPRGQEPRLFTEETSEGFWIAPGEGYRRFLSGDMKMAEPAEYGLAYLSQFASLAELLAAHDDRRHKFQGIAHRMDVAWSSFDWKQNRFPSKSL